MRALSKQLTQKWPEALWRLRPMRRGVVLYEALSKASMEIRSQAGLRVFDFGSLPLRLRPLEETRAEDPRLPIFWLCSR